MMQQLAREQNKRSGLVAILGIPADSAWLQSGYHAELSHLDMPYILAPVPKLFGTGAFFLSILVNPLRRWLRHIRRAFPNVEIVVHSHSAWLTGGYLPLSQRDKIGLVATFHGIADDKRLRDIWWLGTAHRFLARRLYHSQAILSSVSHETAQRAERIFQIPQRAFSVVPNGMTPLHFQEGKICLAPADLIIGHVGQMHQGKGWRLLVQAVDAVRQEGWNVQLVLAGTGEDANLAEQEAKKRKDYMQFLGVVPNAGTCLIPKLDVLVLATWSEGMPMSIIEAFAAGIPVIATAVGGIPEMIEDGVNGLLIERNAQSIAQALRRFLEDPQLIVRLRTGALKTFSEKFAISQVVSRYASLYDRAMVTVLSREGEK